MIKLIACVLYLNGLGFRRIGAILKVNHNSVIRWVKEYGKEIEKIFPIDKTKRHCKVIEIDEMWHYVGKKTKIVDLDCFGSRNKRSASLANGIKRKKDTQEITYTNLSYFL